MTKDADFGELLEQHGSPPRVVLVTCGNTSNARLRRLVQVAWPDVLTVLDRGDLLVELGDRFDRALNALSSDCTKLHHASQKTGTQAAAIGDGRREIWPEIHYPSPSITNIGSLGGGCSIP